MQDKIIYEIDVQEPSFSQIKDGSKKIEGRLNKSKFLRMKTGDEILINKEVLVEIVNRTEHKTFKDMIIFYGVKNVIPEAETIEDAEAVYYKYYSKEDEVAFGVVALEIKVM